MSLVEIADLRFQYAGASALALDVPALNIESGEFVVFAGPSGSGKSTLLAAVSGLVPHFHGGEISGSVEIAGLSTREHGPGDLSLLVGTVLQDPEAQTILGSPRAELAFALENRGLSGPAISVAVEEVALALAIDPLLDRATDSLSGGELQRVALGAALTPRPVVACLDEPTSQLDPVAGDELIALLRRLNDDAELTVLLADHRLERCLPHADRVIALDAGTIAFDGPPTAFLSWAVAHAPSLATPGATLLQSLSLPPAPSVKRARNVLRAAGYDVGRVRSPGSINPVRRDFDRNIAGLTGSSDPNLRRTGLRRPSLAVRRPRTDRAPAALELKSVWHELKGGAAILRGTSLRVEPGERVAVMGRNGAGKSTLLRHAAGLTEPTRGTVDRGGRVALLLQNPNDYLVHELVAEEARPAALAAVGLEQLADRHPRDLSGGERQRLAIAIVLGDPAEKMPSVLCLDEPTRGMDRGFKHDLVKLLRGLDGPAQIVATHDPEFAAEFADRVVLMADGAVIADGSAAEVLGGGTYFATETARILGGGALLPAAGTELLAQVTPVSR